MIKVNIIFHYSSRQKTIKNNREISTTQSGGSVSLQLNFYPKRLIRLLSGG